MTRPVDDETDLRERINEILGVFNADYADLTKNPDEKSIQDIGDKILFVWENYFSGGRILQTDLELLTAMSSIPLSHWPESIAIEAYTEFTRLMGKPVVTQFNSDRIRKDSGYLRKYGADVTSQSGEDGILRHIFQTIGARNEWCVEFGAWDGKEHSNTYALIAESGWHGVLIEGMEDRFRELEATYSGNDKTVLINDYVGFDDERNSLDYLLGKTEIPVNFDLAIIDIDGNDWHVWNSMQHYRPRVVVIEHNPTVPNDVVFIQERSPDVLQGCSLRALVMLGKSKGYELICTTNYNGIFVLEEEFSKFGIEDNSIDAMHTPLMDGRIFHCYDYSIYSIGMPTLIWDSKKRGKDWASKMPTGFKVEDY